MGVPPKLDPTWGLVTGEDTEFDRDPDESEESLSGSCCFICWLEECGLFEAVELKGVPLDETKRERERESGYTHTLSLIVIQYKTATHCLKSSTCPFADHWPPALRDYPRSGHHARHCPVAGGQGSAKRPGNEIIDR